MRHAEGLFAIASEGGWVATMDGANENVDRANARLIAAAPDLLAALETCLKAGTSIRAIKQASAAMAKVRGKEAPTTQT